MLMEFWGCHAKALRGRGGELTCFLADGMAHKLVARAFSSRKLHERLHAVQCIHVLKNPQGAVLSAQNSAFFNLSANKKQGLRKRSLQWFVAQPKPKIGKLAPQGTQMNEIITQEVAKRTQCKQWQMGGYMTSTRHLQSRRYS